MPMPSEGCSDGIGIEKEEPRFLPFVFEAEYLTAEIVQEDVFVFHA